MKIFLTPAWSSTVRNSITKAHITSRDVSVGSYSLCSLWSYAGYIFFLSTLHKLKSSGKRKPQWKKNTSNRLAYRQVCRTFSWFVINVGVYRLLWAVPPLVTWFWEIDESRANNHGDQANRQHSCMHAFCICSCLQVPTLFKFLPCLSSMIAMIRMYKLNKPFLSQEGKVLIIILSQHQKAI